MAIANDEAAAAAAAETPGDLIERLGRRLTTAAVIAAAIIGLAVYARPAPPRYQAFAAGSQIVRIDTRTGTITGCEAGQTCVTILRRGQRLARRPKPEALPKPAAATPLPAAPAAGR
jgi:hypothetical protein